MYSETTRLKMLEWKNVMKKKQAECTSVCSYVGVVSH